MLGWNKTRDPLQRDLGTAAGDLEFPPYDVMSPELGGFYGGNRQIN